MDWVPKYGFYRAFAITALSAAGLIGCGSGPVATSGSSTTTTATIQGRVMGGQQPVANAQIILYAAGTNVTGGAPKNLLGSTTVYTDTNGNFNLPAAINCPSSTAQTYAVALHGNPGLTPAVDNQALVLMTALGDCESATANFIAINEVTTAAAAWALSQFLGPAAAVTSSPSNPIGLSNAFLLAQTLVDTSTGLSPGTGLPAGAVLESAKIYALANVLAPCVNSAGTTGCDALFSATQIGSSQVNNTLDAALNIVRNPGTNVLNVFKVAASKDPFQPALGSAPHDWTLSVTYQGGGLKEPGEIAIDSSGYVWTPNNGASVLSEFSPVGQPVTASGYAGAGLNQSIGIAIDPSGDVWVSNENSVAGAGNHGFGSLSRFSSQGTEVSGFGYTGGGLYYPVSVAADPNGTIWAADYGSSSATLLNSSGGAISGSNGFGTSQLPFTPAVAVDASHNAWFAVEEGLATITPAGVVSQYPCCNDPEGIAVDQGGSIWLADYGAGSIVKVSTAGSVQADLLSPDGNSAAQKLAIDGAGNVFAANFRGNNIMELANSPAAFTSPTDGYGLDAPLSEPFGIAVDASGNLWVTNTYTSTLTQFVGLANPVHTPMAGPPSTP